MAFILPDIAVLSAGGRNRLPAFIVLVPVVLHGLYHRQFMRLYQVAIHISIPTALLVGIRDKREIQTRTSYRGPECSRPV